MIRHCCSVHAGTCRHPERVVLKGGKPWPVTMPTVVGVVEHSREGLVLFDLGYSPEVTRACRTFPESLYPVVVPFEVDATTTARGRLIAMGYRPEDVRHIIISHFHPDHIGGARDFPKATFHTARAAWGEVAGTRGPRRWKHVWMPELLPDDFLDRTEFIDVLPDAGYGPFGQGADLFGDGTLRLLPLPGHAAGQLGLLVEVGEGRRVFFTADATWTSKNIHRNVGPSRMTSFVAHDGVAASDTLRKLHDLWKTDPTVDIVPSHCPDRVAQTWVERSA